MQRALFAINILLGALVLAVLALAAREAVVLKYGPSGLKARSGAVSSAPPTLALTQYSAIPESGLFGKGTLTPVAEADGTGQGPASLVLVGTAEGAGYAIFMDMGAGKQKAFKKGESVFGGGVVVSVSTKKAELESGGRRVSFSVPSSTPGAPGAGMGQQKAQLTTSKGEGEYVVDQRAMSGVFDNMDKVLTDARFTPYIDGGKLTGFRVSEVKAGGVFSLIGLQNGDVVLSINEYKLDSPGKVAQILGGLRGESEVKVDVLRGAQPRTLRYQIR
jgi:general secretion pathway protein C